MSGKNNFVKLGITETVKAIPGKNNFVKHGITLSVKAIPGKNNFVKLMRQGEGEDSNEVGTAPCDRN